MITQAIQDYLKIIYKLSAREKAVTTNAIAERMKISQASVTGMLKKLAALKLIDYKKYYGVELTEAGKKIALEIIRHHRLLEAYLSEALGYSWDEVHDEAEKLEHHISEEFEERMAQFLGDPSFDPHGAPIPTKDGQMPQRKGNVHLLSESEAGSTVAIQQVCDTNPEVLRYLGEIGIYPDQELEVMSKAPFGGPLHVRINEIDHHLGEQLTNQIRVATKQSFVKQKQE